jgi:hypothetical protein
MTQHLFGRGEFNRRLGLGVNLLFLLLLLL